MKVATCIAMILAAATTAAALPVPQPQSIGTSAERGLQKRGGNAQGQGNQNNQQNNNQGNNQGNAQGGQGQNNKGNGQGNNQDNKQGNNNQGNNNQGNNNGAGDNKAGAGNNNNNGGNNNGGNNGGNNNGGNNNGGNGGGGNNNGGNGGGAGGEADFGTCNPTIEFALGRPGRKPDQGTFLPVDPAILRGQSDALAPGIIMNRVCDQLNSQTCNANQAAIQKCLAAKAQVEATGTRDATTADLFNSLVQ